MKVYKIKVNGKAYEVEVESVSENNQHIEVAASNASAASDGANVIKAPMAGSIIKVNVSVGQTIKKDDVVVVLEAMKLENDVKSPFNGTIKAINVSKGSAVKNGDVLIVLE